MIGKLEEIAVRYQELKNIIADPETLKNITRYRSLLRELSEKEQITEKFDTIKSLEKQLAETRLLLADSDPEIKNMAAAEIAVYEKKIRDLSGQIRMLLLPRDPNSGKNIIVEIRAGTGGDEASLFAADLFRMYQRFCDAEKLKNEVLSFSETGLSGFKEIIFSVSGNSAWDKMKFEMGTHRVQRIPRTESSGRIHTSTATVAVMPEVEEAEFEIDPDELRIEVCRAGGAGGQHVNKTESAVRIIHIPTGITVSCQDDRSQHKNKAKGMKILRARLFDLYERERKEKEDSVRRKQIGSGERSEKIRTYNFPQSRITDHRINLTMHNLENFIEGGMQELIAALQANESEMLLRAVPAQKTA
ncbi:MAG: peptide chain release factor 1 [Spirochaetes bacterium GWF1_41_5]|nr:MAG: peptide chain release factor 1 [Spirochaetes bacterium GWF1_41_5]HBE01404.1 peptide chain release factor 1 [Spirochaetia bacterium]